MMIFRVGSFFSKRYETRSFDDVVSNRRYMVDRIIACKAVLNINLGGKYVIRNVKVFLGVMVNGININERIKLDEYVGRFLFGFCIESYPEVRLSGFKICI